MEEQEKSLKNRKSTMYGRYRRLLGDTAHTATASDGDPGEGKTGHIKSKGDFILKQKAGTSHYMTSVSSRMIQLSSILDRFGGSSNQDEMKVKGEKQEVGR